MGCLGYADDILLLSGSRTGLQVMVDMCGKFAKEKNLKFSTDSNPVKSKTKCIVFSKSSRDRLHVAPVHLNSDPLPWVTQVKHLGNVLQSDNSMKIDCTLKRGRFIGKTNSLLQEFHFVKKEVLMKILNIYTTSFYGSGLWDLYSREVDRLYKAWNVTIRKALSIPNTTHRYLIEPLSGCIHPKVMLASRLTKFRDTIRNSNSGGLLTPATSKKNLKYCLSGESLLY